MQLTPTQTAFGFSGPLYEQVAAYLRGRIAAEIWTSAAPLPNEAALAKEIGVSIGTVRKALEILEDEKLIARRQGRGTFVVDASEQADSGRFSLLTFSGRRLRCEVTEFTVEVGVPPEEAGQALNLPIDTPAIMVTMAWRAGQCVRAHERIVVSEKTFSGLQSIAAPSAPTLFHIYRRNYRVVVHRIAERVSAEVADEGTSQALGIDLNAPVLQVTRIARTRTGEAIEWSSRRMSLGGADYIVTLG